MRHLKPTAPIPFASESQDWFLPLLLGLLQYLLGLLLIVFLVFHGMVQRWDIVLHNHLTLEVTESEKPQLEPLVTSIQSAPNVQKATVISDKQLAVTLQPWLGNIADEVIAGLPLPHLIDIEIKSGKVFDADTLLMQLRQKFPDQTIDFSNSWANDILALVKILRLMAFGLLGLLTLIVVIVVVFVVRSRLRIHYDEIELLHIMGASDKFVSKLFQRQILWASLKGTFIAILCFAFTILLFVFYTTLRPIDFLFNAIMPLQTMAMPFAIALAALPLMVLLVAVATARGSVSRFLYKLF